MIMCDSGEDDENQKMFNVDDSLEDRLKAHGISKRNVRSIIHEIFSDENVMKLLKNADDEPELDFADVALTRSKKKQNENNEILNPLELSSDFTDYQYDMIFDNKKEADVVVPAFDCNPTMDSIYTEHYNTDSCYDEAGEFDWRTWLASFNEGGQDKEPTNDEDDNSEEDPDFNFLAELEEPDVEDFRNDCATRISKRELESLTCKKKRNTADDIRSSMGKKDKTENTIYTVNDFLQCKTLREKLIMLRNNPELKKHTKKKRKRQDETKQILFTEQQKHELSQQLQQHVQLLTQTCVLEWQVNERFQDSSNYLRELDYFRVRGPEITRFDVLHLRDAINIVQYIDTSISLNCDGKSSSDTGKMKVMSNCPVFKYSELLPEFITEKLDSCEKRPFTFHEDCLIAHGLHEMSQNFYISPPELISQILMPHRSKQEIKTRIKIIMMAKTRKNSNNPINQYKIFGTLPPSHRKVMPVFFHSAKKPIEMEGKLPEWLHEMRKKIQGKCMENDERSDQEKQQSKCEKLKILSQPQKSSAKNIKKTDSGQLLEYWTQSMDEKILTVCKQYNGPSKEALFLLTCAIPSRSKKHIKKRFYELLTMYCKAESSICY